ncbi:neurotrypsin-like [Penaeus chinensis]|uniref:neurotrypsin-like n=1 Tax=Penaeus chinensis TaxID=139456 RepID=UPI001FB7E498|nr:neurotrypsin-like [Penaeus chinensis]
MTWKGLPFIIILSLVFSDAQDIRSIQQIRLVGGRTITEGNLQVAVNGVWGSVCDDGFGFAEADVTCRELGFEGADYFTWNNHFGNNSSELRRGQTKYWLDRLNCDGVTRLAECSSSQLGMHDCGPTEIAGVMCRTIHSKCSGQEFPCSDRGGCVARSLVCDGSVHCSDGSDEKEELCEDVGVIRLRESSRRFEVPGMVAGTVAVKRRGSWSSLCGRFLVSDARVLCRSLGYGGGWTVPLYRGYLGKGLSPAIQSLPQCEGHEAWIGECPGETWGEERCPIGLELGVLCSVEDVAVRLANGRLEVRLERFPWASVCSVGFDDLDARVVCRMMGHEGDAIATSGLQQSPGSVWNVIIDCVGHEVQLQQCRLRLMNSRCQTAAGVSCSSKKGEVDAKLRSLLPTDCGVPEDSSRRYIGGLAKSRGGIIPALFDFPWLVSLRRKEHPGGGALICGGSVISEDYILTAGHCLRLRADLEIVVRAGDYNSRFVEGSFEQEFEIDKVWVHERYEEHDRFDNDIALIKIQRRNGRGFRFSERVRPVCLPSFDASYDDLGACKLVGWGETNFNAGATSRPREVTTFVLPDYWCDNFFDGSVSYTSSQVCTGGGSSLNRSGCHGDSGGPLACLTRGRYTLYGLLSSGSGCKSDKISFFNTYTRIVKYLHWIQEKIASAGGRQSG